MPAVKTRYNPRDIVLTLGTFIITGFADGTFINIEQDEDSFSDVSGADGEVERAASNDGRATANITLLQGADSNSFLASLHAADKLTGQGVVPFLMKDLNSVDLVTAANAWIIKPAAIERGKEIVGQEWSIRLADAIIFPGGLSL